MFQHAAAALGVIALGFSRAIVNRGPPGSEGAVRAANGQQTCETPWLKHAESFRRAPNRRVNRAMSCPLSSTWRSSNVGPLTYPAPGLPHREDDRLSLIDMQSDRVASSIRLGRSTTSIAFGYGSAWIGAYDRNASWLAVIGAGSTKPEWIRLVRGDDCGPPYDPGPYGAPVVAIGAGSVWVLTCGQSKGELLIKVNPETRRILAEIPMSRLAPSFLAVGAGSVWVDNGRGPSVAQIDPRTNKVIRTIRVGGNTCGIAATRDAVWLAVGDDACDTIGQ